MNKNLNQWPIQIKLIDPNHQAFNDNDLVVAADCCGYAYPEFMNKFGDNTIIIGCPKLDDIDYSIKLKEIFENNNINKVHIVRMIVPCCMGIENMVKRAITESGKNIDVATYIISTEGEISEG